MYKHRHLLIVFTILALLLFSACNMPSGTPTASGVDLINTAAAQTVAARLTQAAQPPATQAGVTPVPATTVPGETPAAQDSPAPTDAAAGATATAVPCDKVKFVEDVTYPDNSEVAPGQTFVKTWRLENVGSCSWTTAYALVFAGKDPMEAPEALPLTITVAPGERIDLSVTLRAPGTGGTYRGDFKLRNADNTQFGIGPQDEPFYVQIKVPVATGIVYDFISRSGAATWVSGIGDTFDTSLTFGGAEDDPNGLAAIRDGVRLETGAVSGKVLLTVPKHDNNGAIAGIFPEYQVQNGDRLRGRLAFMANADGNCGAGNVVFQITYQEGDQVTQLDQWEKVCSGSMIPVDIDLSGLRDRTVKFILVVRANGSAQDDWAIWNSVRIERQ